MGQATYYHMTGETSQQLGDPSVTEAQFAAAILIEASKVTFQLQHFMLFEEVLDGKVDLIGFHGNNFGDSTIFNHEKLRISLCKRWISWETKKGNEWNKCGFHWSIPIKRRFLGDFLGISPPLVLRKKRWKMG